MKLINVGFKKIILSLLVLVTFLGISLFSTFTVESYKATVQAEFVPPAQTSEKWIELEGLAEHTLEGDGSLESPYLISTAEDLAFIAYKTRLSSNWDNFSEKYFLQTDDINLSGKRWTPIGLTSNNATYNRRFAGNFNGGGFDILNLHIEETEMSYLGLFGGVEGGEFKNINIVNGYVNALTRDYAALFAAQAYNVSIDNITTDGYVGNYGAAQEGINNYVAGVVAMINTLENPERNKITNVTNNAEVHGRTYVAGVVSRCINTVLEYTVNNGLISAERESSGSIYAGGIVAQVEGANEIVFKGLSNTGQVQSRHSTAGGIVAISTFQNVRLKIQDSQNSGPIFVGGNVAGGICGRADFVTLENVTNSGRIEGRNELGGLVGRSSRINIINSSNAEIAEIVSETYNAGGLIGYVDNQTDILNSHNYGKIISDLNVTGYLGVGGLVGVWTGRSSSITNSTNASSAVVIGASAGGAIGYTNGGGIVIDNFINYGQIVSSPINRYNNLRGTGGVIGLSAGSGSVIEILNSKNFGELLGSFVGGAVGNAYSTSTFIIDNFENNNDLTFNKEMIKDLSSEEIELYQIPADYLRTPAESSAGPNENDSIVTKGVGGVLGYSNALTTVRNSINNGEISTYGDYVGGLSGYILRAESNIDNFTNTKDVSGNNYVGGITGRSRGTYLNVNQLGNVTGLGNNVGGIIGNAYMLSLENVKIQNTETTLTVSGITNVGGLIGSTNNGSIVSLSDSENYATVNGTSSVGGLVGRTNQTINIIDSNNLGDVNSTSYYTGGFIGLHNAGILSVINSNNNGDITSTVISRNANNYNYATGGFVGSINSNGSQVNISKSINNGNITGQFVGGIIGYNNASIITNVYLTEVENKGIILSNSEVINSDPIQYNYGYAGGILGTSSNTGVLNLVKVKNSGAVTGKFAGGIAGRAGTIIGEEAVNTGTITSNANLILNPSNGLPYNNNRSIGGVAGLIYQGINNIELTNSENDGELVALGSWQFAGGLIATTRNVTLNQCKNNVDINLTISKTYSFDNFVGGLVAYASNSIIFKITKSQNLGDINSKANFVGGLVGAVYNAYGLTANNGTTVISESCINANVISSAANNEFATYVGGIIGHNRGGLDLSNIMVTGNVSGNERIGGLIGRVEMYSNVCENLIYLIRNISFNGNFVGSNYDNNSRIGGGIGEVWYNIHASLRAETLPLTIEYCFNIAKFTGEKVDSSPLSNTAYGGFIGQIVFGGGTITDIVSTVSVNYCLYAVSSEESDGYGNFNAVGNIQNGINGTYSDSTSITFTKEQFAVRDTYDNWKFNGEGVGTGEKTYWAIASSTEGFNNGLPFLTNMFTGTINFNFNDGTDDKVTIEYLIGNQILITEKMITKPSKKYFDFAGWSLTLDGPVDYLYDETIESYDETLDLWAVWVPEKIYIDALGTAELTDGEEVLQDKYIERSLTNLIVEANPNTASGEVFQNWEIFDPQLSQFVYFDYPSENIILLNNGAEDEILNDAFVDRWSFIDDNGRKSIRFCPISIGLTAYISINFASEQSNLAIIEVDDSAYRIGTLLSYNVDSSFNLTINPITHYSFVDFVVKNNLGEIIEDYSEDLECELISNNKYEFTIKSAERFIIELSFEKIVYTVTVKQVKNDLTTEITDIDLVNGDEDTITVKIGEQISPLNYISVDNYGFINFLILNNVSVYERYTSGMEITEDFLNKFVKNGNIEILAVFVEKFLFKISIDESGDGQGSFEAYIRQDNGEIERTLTNNEYVNANSNIIIIATPSSNSIFGGFGGMTEYNQNIADFRINSDVEITVLFESFYYNIISRTVDNYNQVLEQNNVDISASVNNNKIVEGTLIYSIGLIEDTVPGYVFDSWHFNVNGTLIEITPDMFNISANNVISDISVTNEFLSLYANENNDIIVVAKYFEVYTLNIESSDVQKGTFKLFRVDEGQNVELAQDESNFAYGTKLLIQANITNEEYYNFIDFVGINTELGDVVNLTNKTVEITLTTNRFIILNYESKMFEITKNANTLNAMGNLVFSSDRMGVGETIVISFNVSSGYEIKSWIIYDIDGTAHSAGDLSNIRYTNNTLVLTVDEEWLENFGTEFNSEIKTMMNSTYLTILLTGGITAPILLAGILLFIILNNKKKKQVKLAMQKREAAQFGLNQKQFLESLTKDNNNDK